MTWRGRRAKCWFQLPGTPPVIWGVLLQPGHVSVRVWALLCTDFVDVAWDTNCCPPPQHLIEIDGVVWIGGCFELSNAELVRGYVVQQGGGIVDRHEIMGGCASEPGVSATAVTPHNPRWDFKKNKNGKFKN